MPREAARESNFSRYFLSLALLARLGVLSLRAYGDSARASSHLIAPHLGQMGAAKQKKSGKAGKAGKTSRNSKAGQPKAAQSLKQQQERTHKIIRADQMKWKPVELPDRLDDWTGFYGLEELEGVDVRMVNGMPEFVEKDVEVDVDKLLGEKGKKGKKGKDKRKAKGEEEEKEEEDIKEEKDKKEKKEQKMQENKEGTAEKEDEHDEKQNEEAADESDDSDEFTGFDDDDRETHEELLPTAFLALAAPLPDDIDLPAWAEFDLSTYTLAGLADAGFAEPTPIQAQAIPLALAGRDVVGKATTGSGKTLAYGIPILEAYMRREQGKNQPHADGDAERDAAKPSTPKVASKSAPQGAQNEDSDPVQPPVALIFAPTRELAHQVVDHLNRIARFSPLAQNGVVALTGGLSLQKQERILTYGPGIVVATPGRFLEHMERSAAVAARMAAAQIVVLDEADRLLQDGHFDEFEKILEELARERNRAVYGKRWQTLVFSATFARELFGKLDRAARKGPPQDEMLDLLRQKLQFRDKQPQVCDANPKELVASNVTEALVECGATERDLHLYYFLLAYPGATLVFANSVEAVRRLAPLLTNLGVAAFSIHSAMAQKQRLRALERFRLACTGAGSGPPKTAVLVATDVAARGLDIPRIDHVAHYHLPRLADVYVHRSGRTGRAGRPGAAVMFCSPHEAAGPLQRLRRLVADSANKSARADLPLLPIDLDILLQVRERVKLAARLGDAAVVSTATRKENLWLRQAADDLGIEDLAEIDAFEDDVIKKQRQRKERKLLSADEARNLRLQLAQLLQTPLRKNHRRSYLTGADNLAHQIVTGQTSLHILGLRLTTALAALGKVQKAPVERRGRAKGRPQKGKKGRR